MFNSMAGARGGSGLYSWSDAYPASPLAPDNNIPTTTAAVSGKDPSAPAAAPAISWLGVLAVLVLLRVFYEFLPEE